MLLIHAYYLRLETKARGITGASCPTLPINLVETIGRTLNGWRLEIGLFPVLDLASENRTGALSSKDTIGATIINLPMH
jgi:hypothetical protein